MHETSVEVLRTVELGVESVNRPRRVLTTLYKYRRYIYRYNFNYTEQYVPCVRARSPSLGGALFPLAGAARSLDTPDRTG